MKKTVLFLCVIAAAISVCGCSAQKELSDKDNDSMAEYMAGSLLKHDKNYDQALVYNTKETPGTEEPAVETPAPASPGAVAPAEPSGTQNPLESSEPTGDPSIPDDSDTSKTCELSELYSVDGITISYDSVSTGASYPKGDKSSYYSVVAENKNKLIVLNFNVSNTTSHKVMLNLLQSGVSYQLEASDGKTYDPLISIIVEDLQHLNYNVEKKAKDKAVLIFEVPEGVKTEKCVFHASVDGKICNITLGR